MQPKRYPFEGELLTVGEVRARVPALSRSAVVRYLKSGVTKRTDMLQGYRPKRKGTPGWNTLRRTKTA